MARLCFMLPLWLQLARSAIGAPNAPPPTTGETNTTSITSTTSTSLISVGTATWPHSTPSNNPSVPDPGHSDPPAIVTGPHPGIASWSKTAHHGHNTITPPAPIYSATQPIATYDAGAEPTLLTETNPPIPGAPGPTPYHAPETGASTAVFVLGGTSYTAIETNGLIIIGSITLSAGGPAATLDGQVISENAQGALVLGAPESDSDPPSVDPGAAGGQALPDGDDGSSTSSMTESATSTASSGDNVQNTAPRIPIATPTTGTSHKATSTVAQLKTASQKHTTTSTTASTTTTSNAAVPTMAGLSGQWSIGSLVVALIASL